MSAASLSLITFVALGVLSPALAIRHDVDEADYRELGDTFPAVVQVGGLASGVLIDADWVLTAAHAPEMIQRMRRGAPLEVTVEGTRYKVARVVIPKQRSEEPDRHDIALLQLEKPVPETVTPLALFERKVETGSKFVLAGWGILAKGSEGIEVSPAAMAAPTRARRAGWNTVTRRDDERSQLFADFDGPEKGLELEAGPCIGDSGGPLLIRVPGHEEAPATWRVAGVIALIDDADKDHIVGEYGEEFGATAVLAYVDWIRKTLAD